MDQLTLPMGAAEIQRCIPHRFPFLLIDRIVELEPSRRIAARKLVSATDPWLQEHFPRHPLVPGVLLIEMAAQAAAVLGHISAATGLSVCSLAEVSSSRFRRAAVSGDELAIEVQLSKQRPPFFWFDSSVEVAGRQIAAVKFSAFMK